MRTTIYYCLSVFIILLALVAGEFASASNDAVFRLTPSNNPDTGGTAFLIEHNGKQVLLSNRHVCDIPSVGGLFVADNGKDKIAAIVTHLAETDDLCLLTPFKTIEAKPIPIAHRTPRPGAIVYSQGYPRLGNEVRSTGVLLAYEAQIGFYKEGHNIVMGKTSFRAIPGMSGSPVMDLNGDAIGVIARLALHDSQAGLFVTLDRVHEFLNVTRKTGLTTRQTINLVAKQKAIKHQMDVRLVLAIIEVESSFRPDVIGPSGEIGLLQLRPEFHQCAVFDITKNIECGVGYLAYVRDKKSDEHPCAWFTYFNWGPYSALKRPEATEYYKRVMDAMERL